MAPVSLRRDLLLIHLPLTLLLLVVLAAGVGLGRVRLPAGQVLRVLTGQSQSDDARVRSILLEVRLPRLLLGAVVGAALGLAGCLMQGLFRNPLADPGVLGVSAGGALGAVTALYLGWGAYSLIAVPLAGFSTALLTSLLVYSIAAASGGFRMGTLLLAGIAVGSLATALTSVLIVQTRDYALQDIVFWLMGGLAGASWPMVEVAGLSVLLGTLASACFARDLNAMLTGEQAAAAVGVDVPLTRLTLLILSSLLTGVAVAAAGILGFVGLVVPHLLRLVVGPDHRRLIPASVLVGATFLVGADVLSQAATGSGELPLGVVTSLAGAPFFIYLLLSRRREVLSL